MRRVMLLLAAGVAAVACNHVDGPLPSAPRAVYGVTVVSQSSPCTVLVDLVNADEGGGLRLSVALGVALRDSLVLGSGRYVRDVTVQIDGALPQHATDSVTVPGSVHVSC